MSRISEYDSLKDKGLQVNYHKPKELFAKGLNFPGLKFIFQWKKPVDRVYPPVDHVHDLVHTVAHGSGGGASP
jgi:hypothetical protein